MDDVPKGLHCRTAGERSLKNLLRWLIKARSLRPLCRMSDPPVVPVLGMLFELLSAKDGYVRCPEKLYRLWTRFN